MWLRTYRRDVYPVCHLQNNWEATCISHYQAQLTIFILNYTLNTVTMCDALTPNMLSLVLVAFYVTIDCTYIHNYIWRMILLLVSGIGKLPSHIFLKMTHHIVGIDQSFI